MTPTPVATKGSSAVCRRTIQKRNNFIKDQIACSSKDIDLQTGLLVKSFQASERQTIIEKAGIKPAFIGPAELVAMKSNLGLPWERMKAMSR